MDPDITDGSIKKKRRKQALVLAVDENQSASSESLLFDTDPPIRHDIPETVIVSDQTPSVPTSAVVSQESKNHKTADTVPNPTTENEKNTERVREYYRAFYAQPSMRWIDNVPELFRRKQIALGLLSDDTKAPK